MFAMFIQNNDPMLTFDLFIAVPDLLLILFNGETLECYSLQMYKKTYGKNTIKD